MAKQILNGLPVATGILDVDGQKGPKVDLSNSYAAKKATEDKIKEIEETLEDKLEESDLSDYLTSKDASDTYEPKVNWESKLAGYAKSTDIPDDYLTDDDIKDFITGTEADGKYATKTDLNGKADSQTVTELTAEVAKKLGKEEASTTYAPISVTTTKADQTELDKTNAEVAKKANTTDLANYYTREELNGKLSSAMHYRGTVANYAALEALTDTAEAGDLYNVEDTGANYAFDAEKKVWDKQSENIDISGKADKTDLEQVKTDLALKATKEELKDYAKAETVTQLSTTVEGKLGKEEASGIYATITTVNGKADKTELEKTNAEVAKKLDASDYFELKGVKKTLTLSSSGWQNKKQNLSLTGFEDCTRLWTDLASKAQKGQFVLDGIELVDAENDNVLTFTCGDTTPTTDYLIVVSGDNLPLN